MKKKYILLFAFTIFYISILNTNAHPGRTDYKGCHTCRTNCESWGLNYGQYHCHNGTESSNNSSSVKTYTPQYIYGCTDKNSINYNATATKDDSSCIKKVYGCMNSDAYNYNENANIDDGSCVAKVYGCTDKNAINFNTGANTSDGTCLYTRYKTTYKKIKYRTKYKYKIFYKKGKVLQKGKYGKEKIQQQLTINENGDIIETKILNKKIITKPTNKIVVTKTKKK